MSGTQLSGVGVRVGTGGGGVGALSGVPVVAGHGGAVVDVGGLGVVVGPGERHWGGGWGWFGGRFGFRLGLGRDWLNCTSQS